MADSVTISNDTITYSQDATPRATVTMSDTALAITSDSSVSATLDSTTDVNAFRVNTAGSSNATGADTDNLFFEVINNAGATAKTGLRLFSGSGGGNPGRIIMQSGGNTASVAFDETTQALDFASRNFTHASTLGGVTLESTTGDVELNASGNLRIFNNTSLDWPTGTPTTGAALTVPGGNLGSAAMRPVAGEIFSSVLNVSSSAVFHLNFHYMTFSNNNFAKWFPMPHAMKIIRITFCGDSEFFDKWPNLGSVIIKIFKENPAVAQDATQVGSAVFPRITALSFPQEINDQDNPDGSSSGGRNFAVWSDLDLDFEENESLACEVTLPGSVSGGEIVFYLSYY